MQPTATGDHFTLRLMNVTPNSSLFTQALRFVCVAKVQPNTGVKVHDHEVLKVDVTADTGGACKGAARQIDFPVDFVTLGKSNYAWLGILNVSYSPQSDAWTAKLRGDGTHDLCTDRPGIEQGVRLQDNELIQLYFCP